MKEILTRRIKAKARIRRPWTRWVALGAQASETPGEEALADGDRLVTVDGALITRVRGVTRLERYGEVIDSW